ncbi:MAG: Trp family transcriptional regulator [candidate division WWE3 bacterium]|nr:Trp family transcriptional regulator [candidate division WWE3 bacterium]
MIVDAVESVVKDLAQHIKIAAKVGTSIATVSKVGQVIKYGQGVFKKQLRK